MPRREGAVRGGRSIKVRTVSRAIGPRPSPPERELDVQRLRRCGTFRTFTTGELAELVGLMQRWDASEGTLILSEGRPGGSCFVVVSGSVEVSTAAGGEPRRLATLGPGSIFGQVSLIDGQPRSATAAMRRSGVLLELERTPCERLFETRSPTALKFLAALNQGLIAALRGADRRLMRLQTGGERAPELEVQSVFAAIPL